MRIRCFFAVQERVDSLRKALTALDAQRAVLFRILDPDPYPQIRKLKSERPHSPARSSVRMVECWSCWLQALNPKPQTPNPKP